MQTIQEVLAKSIAFLVLKGIFNPRQQAEEIIGDALDIKRLQLYLNFDRPLNEIEIERCRSLILRRAKREPCQYLRGYVDFLDCKIKVNRDVLIPRQETELLSDQIIQKLSEEKLTGKIFWDICCGSGCIGIAVKKRFPDLNVVLSDLSPEALSVAQENSELNKVDVDFVLGDLLFPFMGQKADYLVCNPPYISESEYSDLNAEVKEFEPKMALIAKEDGIEYYRRLSENLIFHLRPLGKAWFEIGHNQGIKIQQLFPSSLWKRNEVKQDWSGKDRFFFLEIE
jgi:release factor glutamine methyltransferase